MEYVLLDIKNFLKKLENGQVELEAGQWELNKTLSTMNKAVTNLKTLRGDVEDLRYNSSQQMRLIKELQTQLEKLQNMRDRRAMTVSESSVEYSRVTKPRPVESQATAKGIQKKKKCRIRSEEIMQITSRISNEKSESKNESVRTAVEDPEGTDITANGNEQNSDQESFCSTYKTKSYARPIQVQADQSSRCKNNDMLQRYLKDSVKYIDRKGSNMSHRTQYNSQQSEGEERSHSGEYTSLWDDYASRTPQDSISENQIENSLKENSTMTEISERKTLMAEKFSSSMSLKKFTSRADSVRHETKHRVVEPVFYCKECGKGFESREELKDHEVVHRTSSTFKGFGCSYCGKICNSPEKLTAHLKNCRIIMRAHYKKK